MKINIREVVRITLMNHPPNCIFTVNAYAKIVEELEADEDLFKSEAIMLDKVEKAFRKQEIYCPHEGIDRRNEFGLVDK